MWLLTYNGLQKSFAAWGLSDLKRTRVSQAQDTVTFTAPGPYDAAELFPYGSTILISFKNDSTGAVAPWFYGRRIQVPRSGAPTEESMSYTLAGPWWHLDNLVYQQVWSLGLRPHPYDLEEGEVKFGEVTITDPITNEETVYDRIGVYKSRVILGQDPLGAPLASGLVITDVINYAIASGAPIKLGTIEPDLNIPFDEVQDITCSEAIRRLLRWSPDAITWFDYSTSPYPTFHCKRRSALSSLSLPVASIVNVPSASSNLSVTPRPDLQVPSVVLKYEQTNTIDGTEYESVTTDKHPAAATGREFAALTATLELAGFQANYVTQKVEVRAWGEGWWANDDFWRTHDPSIADDEVYELSFVSGTPDPGENYPNELITGQIQDWMNVYVKRHVITAVCLVTIHDSEGNTVREEFRTLSCEIVVTNATTKTYTSLSSLVTGETIPEGLAEALYNSLNPLQYEGSVVLTEQECGLDPSVGAALRAASGFVLNLTGGLPAWSAMSALIQQITEDVDSGRTTISFGPAEQLSPQDLVERLRANRGRGVAYNFVKRTTGESATGSGAGAIALSGPTPLLNTAGVAGQTKLLVITDGTRKFTLDPVAITSGGPEIKLREVSVCENGNVKKMLILASETY